MDRSSSIDRPRCGEAEGARLPDVATVVKVASRAELKDRCRFETRYYVSSAALCAPRAAEANGSSSHVNGAWEKTDA